MTMIVKNAISIDLEDWFCVHNMSQQISRSQWGQYELRVERSTTKILDLLFKRNTKATFFVLGWIAECVPDLIKEIDKQGHEIATHGYYHQLLTEMNPDSFEKDLQRALEVTSRLISQPIVGYRAPSFTITNKTLWAIEILKKYGIEYDSSVFPIKFHPDYGITDAKLDIYRYENNIIEFPMTCVEVFGRRIPCCGGGYFRLYPYKITKMLLKKCQNQGRSIIFYLHPWEFDYRQPRISLPYLKRLRHYNNLDKTQDRFDRLLNDFEFTTVRSVLEL